MMNKIGSLLFLAGFVFLLGLTVSEIFFPIQYNIATNSICDLLSEDSSEKILFGPSEWIFTMTFIFSGSFLTLSAFLIYRQEKNKLLAVFLGIHGLSQIGIVTFYKGWGHYYLSVLTFISGGLTILAFARKLSTPFRHISITLGLLMILALIFFDSMETVFGYGGSERLLSYSIASYVIFIGGYYVGLSAKKDTSDIN